MFSLKNAERPLFSKPRNPWYLTILIIVLATVFMKFTQSFISQITPPQGMIFDRLQIWTAPINDYFQEHGSATNFVLITTSLWIDLCLIFLSLRALFGPTIRPFLEVFFFAVYRQCLQFLILLPIPEGILWRYPGFPSIMNDYSLQHDFYFSAHTGVSLLCAMELIRTGKKWLEVLGFSLFAYVVFALICLRIHYTMDIFTAIFVALYIIYTSERAAGPIDRFLQSLGKKIRTATSRKKTFL